MYGIAFKTFVEVPTPSQPTPTTPSTTPTTLAATGADLQWLPLASLIAVVAGAGFFALGRRKRTQ
jgi:LPXTG-motif cell wall-anchored protein